MHQLYREFVDKNQYVCPFCGLAAFRNKLGPRREDFDHYLARSLYPLAGANLRNLVPSCTQCNQDYKRDRDILAHGAAFYPFSPIPQIKLEIDCSSYPTPGDFSDAGGWVVRLEPLEPSSGLEPKLRAWDDVYSIRLRLVEQIREFFEEWMEEVFDGEERVLGGDEFRQRIELAQNMARQRSLRRMQPGQLVREAFYDFMLRRADEGFVESFRRQQNASAATA